MTIYRIKNRTTTIIIILLVLTFTSCKENKINAKNIKVNDKFLSGKLDDCYYKFFYDSLNSIFDLTFDKNDSITKSEYQFDKFGSLTIKKGLNFWGEEEKYLFDVNGTLTEFRKLVRFDDKKIGLQEFIRYNNGLINQKKSHYFDYKIIDSSQTNYKVHLSYLGAFKLDTLSVFVNDFSYQINDLKLDENKAILTVNKTEVIFSVPKKHIYYKEFDFFQINVSAHFINDGGLLGLPDEKSKFPNSQTFILRKFSNNAKL